MRRQATALVAIVGLGLALAGCKKAAGPSGGGGGGGTNSANVSIPVTDYGGNATPAFSPTTVAIAPGGSVSWKNDDSVSHTTTSDTNLWNGSLGAGGSFSRTFPVAGTFPYACLVHPGMSGRVVVQ